MATQIIPEQKIVTCDFCKKDRKGNDRYGAVLKLGKAALDYQGSAVADGSLSWDLCDKCCDRILNVLDEAIHAIQKDSRNAQRSREG